MHIEPLAIDGLFLVSPLRHGDDRGFFSEVYRADALTVAGVRVTFVQDNHAHSRQRGVLRGLHYQVPPHAQGKLVRCCRGAILDVAVDLRGGSPTYGRHVSVELSAANWRQLWVPPGFGHGYVTLEADTEVIYKVTDYYAPDCECGIAWDDPDIGVDWRLPADQLILSDKDRRHPRLADTAAPFEHPVSTLDLRRAS
jgi:dTDP-4-dehydrorhamnose 3,5-epimerase